MIKKIRSGTLKVKRKLSYIFSRSLGGKYYCPVCEKSCLYFIPYISDNKAMKHRIKVIEETGIIASPQRAFFCPHCNSSSRDRHFIAMFEKIDFCGKYLKKGYEVLHFAPERGMRDIILQSGCKHVPVDLCPENYKHISGVQKADITDIPFEDNRFDFIICTHVLEHIPDDRKAMSELYRVLKPGRYALLQTPYSDKLDETFVDPSVKTREDQIRVYVEEGHVRIYGKDLFRRFSDAGFELKFVSSASLFSEEDAVRLGFNNKEDLMLLHKPA